MSQTPAPPPSGKDSGFGAGLGETLPNDGTTHAGPLRRGVALAFDVLLLAFSLWLLGGFLPLIWKGYLANDYGKARALLAASVLTWAAAIAGVWLFCALIWGWARQKTLGKRLFLIRTVDDGGPRAGPGHAIVRKGITVFNKLPLTAVIVTLGSIAFDAMGNYERRVTVHVAIGSMEPILAEAARQGCPTGSRPAPDKEIASVDITDAGSGRCTVTLTLARMTGKKKGLSGEKIRWTSERSGPWICSSDMLPEWLPRDCR